MNEAGDPRPALSGASGTAGALLRQARQAQGLHIAALAAAIKVTPRKLELLEADRFEQLPDATFTRALAKAVCRHLKIDPVPVLALLPPPNGHRLEQVAEGLNMPFREHADRMAGKDWPGFSRPAVWVPLLVVLGAAAIYFVPARWLPQVASAVPSSPVDAPKAASSPALAVQPEPAASEAALDAAGSLPASAPIEVTAADKSAVPATAPAPVDQASGMMPPAAAASGALQVQTTAESWVEVIDARGQALLSRVVKPGEVVGLDGPAPMKVKIGNARVTQLNYQGKAVELGPYTRDNIARLELKQSMQP
jgi:cytoskeleton protein RodZ